MPVWTNPADNSTWVFVISTGSTGGIAAYKLLLDASGNPSLGLIWQQAVPSGTALIANNVLYRATNNNIAALNPATGATLWSNASIGTVHWHSPVVANGVLYITDGSSQVTAFSLPSGGLSPLPRTGWVASASATNPGDVPGNALDGNVATRFSTGLPQSSASTQSFTVDMLSARIFSQVTIDSEGGDQARNFQLFASNDPANFGSAIASGNSSGALTTISFTQTSARYLQVRQTTAAGITAWWSISELNVLGPTGTQPGSALPRTGWAFSASATAAGDAVANVADGSATTRWSSGSPQSGATTQTFTVDMLSAQAFDKITLDSGTDFARSFQVFATNNTANWGTAIATGNGTGASTTITFAQQNARFIQIRQATAAGVGSWWSIYELNVFSPSGGPPTALSRTGWTATGSSTAEAPANALDGNTATRWSTSAAQANGQFFQVDMQSAKSFRQLTLDAAANTGDFPHGYQVFVSNDGVNFGSAIASGAPTTQLVTVTFATQTARFIKIVQTGTAANWWSVAEFNAYN
jgi:hypothetical protein